MTNNYSAIRLIIRRSIYFLLFACSTILLTIPSVPSVKAQAGEQQTPPDFSLFLSVEEVALEDEIELTIEATNPGTVPIEDYTFSLYTSEGLTLASNPGESHSLYEPLLSESLDILPGQSEQLVISLYVTGSAKSPEGVALFHLVESEPVELVARLEIPVSDAPPTALGDPPYVPPTPPNVYCGDVPPLSQIGGAVLQAISGENFSVHTWCNRFEGDWILDVPNVKSTTATTTAEAFYFMIADLIRDTDYVFSMSTLTYDTHEESGDDNLVKYYLAPAILDLHNSTPPGGPYPLLRFAYSPGFTADPINCPGFPHYFDEIGEVYADLTADLVAAVPNDDDWRVSIALAEIGDIPFSPWNHSKIAVRDYRHAIVGGMNWELNYILPVDIDGPCSGGHDPTVIIDGTTFYVKRLKDLSLKLEGQAARHAGVYFDLLWKRAIDPVWPHNGDHCVVSWWFPINQPWPIPDWEHDCPLEYVPAYAPPSGIPNYDLTGDEHNVFGLGRGHTGWGNFSEVDKSADDAVLAAFDEAQQSIYISQHKLTSPPDGFSPEVKQAIIDAVVRGVRVKIALPPAWGGASDRPQDVYEALEDELWEAVAD